MGSIYTTTNGFYVVAVSGNNPMPCHAGDVIYYDGAKWVRIAKEDFGTIPEFNLPSTNRNVNHPQSGNGGMPHAFGQDKTGVFWYGVPTGDFAAEFTLSYTPVGEIDAIPLTSDAQECIIAGALAAVYALPGQGQNLQMSMAKNVHFMKEMENLRAIGMFGGGGDAYNNPGNFVGRQNRMSGGYL
jgi:hypothetical protein